MSFEQGILQDLADVVILDRWRSQRSKAGSDDQLSAVSHVSALLLIRSETLMSAPMISTVSCLANLLEAEKPSDVSMSLLGHFMPIGSDTIGQALSELRGDHRFFSLTQAWHHLDGQLRLATALTRALCAANTSEPRRSRVDVEAVADAWRRAARLCLVLHSKTANKLTADGVTTDIAAERSTLALLEDAANGGIGCLDADGLISIPERAERRLSTRAKVSVPVNICVHSINHSATITDASATGLGLWSDTPLAAGTSITVRMPDERELFGTIIWSLGNRAGIRLATNLLANDPIFTP